MYLCRMENEGRESYEILLAVCKADHLQLTVGYKQMRDLLERLCRLHMHNGSLQMTDLSARISFVAAKVGLSAAEQNRLHTFRLTSNAILNRQQEPTREHLLRRRWLSSSVNFLRKIFHRNCISCFPERMPLISWLLRHTSASSGCVSVFSIPMSSICM